MNNYCMIEEVFNNIEDVNKVIDILLSKKLLQIFTLLRVIVELEVKNERDDKIGKRFNYKKTEYRVFNI